MNEEELRTAAARLVATRIEQGLPARVEDPSVLARIAHALVASDRVMTEVRERDTAIAQA
jgi:hypothetical protein